MKIKFCCPYCNRELECGIALSGIKIKCPHCNSQTIVPEDNTIDRGIVLVLRELGEIRSWLTFIAVILGISFFILIFSIMIAIGTR